MLREVGVAEQTAPEGRRQVKDEETLRRFVIRARRVQAHSLVQDWDELQRHAQPGYRLSIDEKQRVTLTRSLPDNEEIFESLASRIRPLTVKAEPVYYAKVFGAIERYVGDDSTDQGRRADVVALREQWDAAEIQGTQIQAYSMQAAKVDGSQASDVVSDTQLAAAWLYADLVHADAKGPKEKALAFPMRDRYTAAVRLFSRMAALTVRTLELIQSLQAAGVISLDDGAWEEPVVVGVSSLTEEGQVYFAPLGGGVPDLRESLEMGDPWKRLTHMEVLRMNPANRVQVLLRDSDSEVVSQHEAAIYQRPLVSESPTWEILIADSVILRFALDVHGDAVAGIGFSGWTMLDATNQLLLASARFVLEMHHASTMVLEIAGQALPPMETPTLDPEEYMEMVVLAETVDNIVAIEALSGNTFAPCNGGFDDRHRLRLRQARLMLEGHVVQGPKGEFKVTVNSGNPPQMIAVPASTLDVGGAVVQLPAFAMRHPGMRCTEVASAMGTDARQYLVAPPDGARFLAWIPERVTVAQDADLVAPTQWDLVGITEEEFG